MRQVVSGRPMLALLAMLAVGFLTSAATADSSSGAGYAWGIALGGSQRQQYCSTAVDPSGNLIVVFPADPGLPAVGGYNTTFQWDDLYVAKISPSGQVVWSTYVYFEQASGEEGPPSCSLVQCDGQGNVYIAGYICTDSISGMSGDMGWVAFAEDVYIEKITSDGQFGWLRVFGGTGYRRERAGALAVDASGRVFVTGWTDSDDFPVTSGLYGHPVEGPSGPTDRFVAAFTPSGQWEWSTYLGGGGDDDPERCLIDPAGALIVEGTTSSPDFPIVNGFWSTGGGSFVAKFYTSTEGGHVRGTLEWSTYLGGAVPYFWFDSSGNLTGVSNTHSTSFPGRNGAADDDFVLKITPSGQLAWAKFLDGIPHNSNGLFALDAAGDVRLYDCTGSNEFGWTSGHVSVISPDGNYVGTTHIPRNPAGTLAADGDGGVVLFGSTWAGTEPVKDAFQPALAGREDTFVSKVSASGEWLWASYLGGAEVEEARSALSDRHGGVYLVGVTESQAPFAHIGTPNASGDDRDLFIARIMTMAVVIGPETLPHGTLGLAYSRALSVANGLGPYTWSIVSGGVPDGLTFDPSTATISGVPTAEGQRTFTVRVSDSLPVPAWTTRDFTITVIEDKEGPAVSGVGTLPSIVREGVETSIALNATAADTDSGGTPIAAAEYSIDAPAAPGSGVAMGAADGAFDEAVEAVTASIDTSSWTVAGGDRTVYLRGKDVLGNWGDVTPLTIPVVDGTAPAAVKDLMIVQMPGLTSIYSAPWEMAGAAAPQEETLTIDLGGLKAIGGVSMTPGAQAKFFPKRFTISGSVDGSNWTTIAGQVDYKAAAGENIWQMDPQEHQYIRITATPLRDAKDGLYHVRVGEVSIFRSAGGNCVRARWTATADDGADVSSGSSAEYDLRYSSAPITAASFDSCAKAAGLPAPAVPGQMEVAICGIGGMGGQVYVALKAADEVPNWSGISNLATAEVKSAGLSTAATADPLTAVAGQAVTLHFSCGSDISKAFVELSDRPDFPTKAIVNGNDTTSKTIKFTLPVGASSWTPSPSRWKAIKMLGANNGTVYWRLTGKGTGYGNIATGAKAILFDTGVVTDMTVTPSHPSEGDEALWPEKGTLPTFQWTDNTKGMKYFWVDVSVDGGMNTGDRKRTVVVGGSGLQGVSQYSLKAAEWKKVRKLGTIGEGTLYWRVRAKDADKALTCASGARKLIIDGGTWTVGDVDLAALSPQVSWTHDGEGIVGYSVEFSADDGFEATARKTVKVPAKSVADSPYSLSVAQVTLLKKLALKNTTTTLHYRIRGEDAERAFMAHSESRIVTVP